MGTEIVPIEHVSIAFRLGGPLRPSMDLTRALAKMRRSQSPFGWVGLSDLMVVALLARVGRTSQSPFGWGGLSDKGNKAK